jgi:hypothetical protein
MSAVATNLVVSIKDVKKGARVLLANGWEADVLDNTVNAHTRMCNVHGMYEEMGSVYSTDIVAVKMGNGWVRVQHTPGQTKAASNRGNWGF